MSRSFSNYGLLSVVLFLFGISLFGRFQVVSGSNFTLDSDEHIYGSLIVLSGNVELKENSFVTGSTIVLCCNLKANGEMVGSVCLPVHDAWSASVD